MIPVAPDKSKEKTTMEPRHESIAVFGPAYNGAGALLRRILEDRGGPDTALILDLTGRGTIALGQVYKNSLPGHPVVWYDIADRRRPSALFHLHRSIYLKEILTSLLRYIRKISGFRVTDKTISWAAEAAFSLSGDGTVGLFTLLRSLSSPDVRQWLFSEKGDPADLLRLLKMLRWALGFPGVYAVSEGNNRVDIYKFMGSKVTVWIEALSEHFEKNEHMIVARLIEAGIEDAVLRFSEDHEKKDKNGGPSLIITYLFPLLDEPERIQRWTRKAKIAIRTISVHKIYADRPLSRSQIAWAKTASTIWVTSPGRPLKNQIHKRWLNRDEISLINSLKPDQVWIRSKNEDRGTIVKTGCSGTLMPLPYKLRFRSSKRRKVTPVRQMATVIASHVKGMGGHHGLYEKLCDPETLRMGWFKVQSAGSDSHGLDGVTVGAFKQNLEHELKILSRQLKNRTYRAKHLLRIYVSKPEGGKRPLGIACVRDRVVQAACLLLLQPVYEQVFSRFSFAFRPGRNAHQALELVRHMIAKGAQWAVIADIKKCFDRIDHGILLSQLSRQIADRDLLLLIRHWLTVDVLDFWDLLPVTIGVPQGESLSPLLANVYLDPLDRHLEKSGLRFVRYADDIIILTSSRESAARALETMEAFLLDHLRLELKPAKTNFVAVSDGFDFLGFHITDSDMTIRPEKIEKVIRVLEAFLKALAKEAGSLRGITCSLTRINSLIRGFRNYFAIPEQPAIERQLRHLDDKLEAMAETMLNQETRNDPEWMSREKFFIPSITQESGGEPLETGGYPEESSNKPPVQWMVKGGSAYSKTQENGCSISRKECEASEDASEESTNSGFIQYEDRLHVLTHGCYLTLIKDHIVIKRRKVEVYRHPVGELALIFLHGFGISLSAGLQLRLAELDIPLVLSSPAGHTMATLNSSTSARASLRAMQILRRDDPDMIVAGLRMLAAKVGNQAALLRYFGKYKKRKSPETALQTMAAAHEIRSLADNIRSLDPEEASVRNIAMGLEGNAAVIYWRELRKFLPGFLDFKGRITRSPTDLMNQCLNYVYGILYGEIWRAVVKAGLDPYFGFIHRAQRDRGSLVFDMIEEFRAPFADRLCIGMIGRGFKPELGKDRFLNMRTKRRLALGFSKRWSKPMSWRSQRLMPSEILETQARSIMKLIKREGDYQPYKMRW